MVACPLSNCAVTHSLCFYFPSGKKDTYVTLRISQCLVLPPLTYELCFLGSCVNNRQTSCLPGICSVGSDATLEIANFIQSRPFSSFLWKLNFNEVQLFALPI